MIKNVKIEKIKDCLSEYEMEEYLYDENIEKYRNNTHKINIFGFCLTYSILIFGVVFFPLCFILFFLLSILGILFLTLYNEIIKEMFIIPIYKDLYEKGYYISGTIEINGNMFRIDECFDDVNDSDKVIKKVIKEFQEHME